MTDAKTIRRELYRVDQPENFRSIAVTVESDGAIDLSAQDMGPLVQELWGDSDYEFGVKVRAEHARALVAALLTELYENRDDGVEAFHDLVKRRGVPHEWWSWA